MGPVINRKVASGPLTGVTVLPMHVITRKRLNEFAALHPGCRAALVHWFSEMHRHQFSDIAEVRAVFPHADKVEKFTVFNLGGNKCRLVAAIHYNRSKVYIRHVLTHSEYDRGDWKTL
jgi:mRNA interferase HigB